MQIHQLQPKHKKSKKRLGRGGKRGTYSGRGLKGQKSRAGRKMRPAIRDYVIRLPKLRGTTNKSVKTKPIVINISELEKSMENGVNIDIKSLIKAGVIRKKITNVKILGNGELKKAFTIHNTIVVSKSAQEKIKKAGGKIIQKT